MIIPNTNVYRGVGYYNKEELRRTKDNILCKQENSFSSSPSGISPSGEEQPSQGQVAGVVVSATESVNLKGNKINPSGLTFT